MPFTVILEIVYKVTQETQGYSFVSHVAKFEKIELHSL